LEDPRVDPSARNNRALEWGMINDHLHVVNRLLDDPRVDPRVDRGVNNILSIAATRGNIDIVNRLLEDPRVDPTFNNNIATSIVCDRIDVARRLYYDPRANVPEFRDYIEQYRAMD
jgi:ankyrin repeat protein